MTATEHLTRTSAPTPIGTPGRSAWAAVLLNLTGLGLGYAYLRRGWRVLPAVLGTAVLVVVAFATDAADLPWLWRAVAVVWLGLHAGDAARLALRSPRPVHNEAVLPVLAGLGALGVLLGGYFGYVAVERATYAAAVAAQKVGDCATAAPAFDAVTERYELTLSDEVPAAAVARTECAAYTVASLEQDLGAAAAAEEALRAFRSEHARSVLLPLVDERLATVTLRRVDATISALATEDGDTRVATARSAFETLLSVRRELGGAPSAARVPQTMLNLFAAAERPYAERKFCDALPTLDYAVTLPEREAAAVVATARAHQAKAQLGCGLAEFRAGHFARAGELMRDLLGGHPGDAGAAQARSVLVAVDVAQATADPIPVPAPLGAGGDRTLTFYNVTSTPVRVEIAGATAADVTVPGCPSCPATQPRSIASCPDPAGLPTKAVRLDGGPYHSLLRSENGRGRTVRAFTAVDGDSYCVFAVAADGAAV